MKKDISSLRSTLEYLEAAGELVTTDVEVDPHLEVAAIQKHFDGGAALLFNKVKGYPNARICNNIFASADRIAKLLDVDDPRKLKHKVVEALRAPLPPVEVGHGPCQDVVITKDIDVWDVVPMISHSDSDPGRTLGAGTTVVRGKHFWVGSHLQVPGDGDHPPRRPAALLRAHRPRDGRALHRRSRERSLLPGAGGPNRSRTLRRHPYSNGHDRLGRRDLPGQEAACPRRGAPAEYPDGRALDLAGRAARHRRRRGRGNLQHRGRPVGPHDAREPQGGHPDDLRGRLRADLPARGAQLGRRAPVDAEQHPVLGRDGHRRDAPVHPQGRLRAGPLQRRGRRPREVLLARADPAGEGRAARLRQVPGGARDLTVAHGAPRAKTAASWSLPLAM